jgi:hypothetical protein
MQEIVRQAVRDYIERTVATSINGRRSDIANVVR